MTEKDNNTIRDEELKDVTGGYFFTSHKYTQEEYEKVGITLEHNLFKADRFFLNGEEITETVAAWYVALHLHDADKK